MDNKNIKLIFAIIGGLMLMVLRTPVFNYMITSMFSDFKSKIIFTMFSCVNILEIILAIIGYIVVATSSVLLIIDNLKPIFSKFVNKKNT